MSVIETVEPSRPTRPALTDTLRVGVRNAWQLTLGDGVESYAGLPTTTVYQGHHRTLLRYESPSARTSVPGTGKPILLVPPLAVSIRCYDLRPGQSLAAWLIKQGRTVYVVDYGSIDFGDRRMGFEDWINDIIPTALKRVSSEHDGAEVDLVGWSLGGTMATWTAAAHPDLPIATITAIGTPCDYSKMAASHVAGQLGRLAGDRVLNLPTYVMGGVPAPLVRAGFKATALTRELSKPWFIARNLSRTETLARMESIDRFMAEMPGYPGRVYLQISSRLLTRNEFARGKVRLSATQVVDLSQVTQRVLVFGSRTDAVAPAAAVAALPRVLTGAVETRYHEISGSHLGIVAGPDAQSTTWEPMLAFHAATS